MRRKTYTTASERTDHLMRLQVLGTSASEADSRQPECDNSRAPAGLLADDDDIDVIIANYQLDMIPLKKPDQILIDSHLQQQTQTGVQGMNTQHVRAATLESAGADCAGCQSSRS